MENKLEKDKRIMENISEIAERVSIISGAGYISTMYSMALLHQYSHASILDGVVKNDNDTLGLRSNSKLISNDFLTREVDFNSNILNEMSISEIASNIKKEALLENELKRERNCIRKQQISREINKLKLLKNRKGV